MPTALFFGAIGLALLLLTALEILRPSAPARGFLPMVTTRGDRFFVSLLSAAFIHLLWLGLLDNGLLAASGISALVAVLLMRWG
jgi:predicted small integral membrane protein